MTYGPKPRPLAERFESHILRGPGDDCWLYQGGHDTYGRIREGGKGTPMLEAHRVAWVLAYGPIPDGLWVLHRCDVHRCVRPDHLFLGTNADNTADRHAKGRDARGERHGMARMSEADAKRVLGLRRQGATNRQIAVAVAMPLRRVAAVTRGESWAHLTSEVADVAGSAG